MEKQKLEMILEAINAAQEALRILTGGCLTLPKLESAEWVIIHELEKAEPKKRGPGRPKKTSR